MIKKQKANISTRPAKSHINQLNLFYLLSIFTGNPNPIAIGSDIRNGEALLNTLKE